MAFRSTCSLLLLLPALLYLATPTNAALSDDEKAELIRAHNFYRAKAKPTPTNMVALVRLTVKFLFYFYFLTMTS